jgi:hypothetical protein
MSIDRCMVEAAAVDLADQVEAQITETGKGLEYGVDEAVVSRVR